MSEIKILILDDDATALQNYQNGIARYNKDGENPASFYPYIADNLELANVHIDRNKLDTAIVDLRLDREDPPMVSGNDAIARLIESFRLPVFVVTGSPADLAEEYEDHPMIKVITRSSITTLDLLKEIASLHNSHYIQFFTRNGFLEKKINELYWKHLSHTSEAWLEVAKTHEIEFDKIIARHTVACLNEQLYVNGNIGSFDKYHPGEFYICPPIKQHYHTGDILEKDGNYFVIMNPACDIVNTGRLNYYLLASVKMLKSIPDLQSKIKSDQKYASFYESLNQQGKTYFDDYKKNKKGERYHYLPCFDSFSDSVIDFQSLQTVPTGEERLDEYIGSYERVASISSPFLKDVVARFSLYYARQGQPNLL